MVQVLCRFLQHAQHPLQHLPSASTSIRALLQTRHQEWLQPLSRPPHPHLLLQPPLPSLPPPPNPPSLEASPHSAQQAAVAEHSGVAQPSVNPLPPPPQLSVALSVGVAQVSLAEGACLVAAQLQQQEPQLHRALPPHPLPHQSLLPPHPPPQQQQRPQHRALLPSRPRLLLRRRCPRQSSPPCPPWLLCSKHKAYSAKPVQPPSGQQTVVVMVVVEMV
mmetsp:Transcript_23208/g.64108  ORF Transcript_23208/g.64108 Transcript_23208/m.64108 type:complete len:219 (-) Transcript_23208:1559-2215(-)